MRDIWVPAIKLCIITLLAAALLGAVNFITREPIARYEAEKKEQARIQVLSQADEFVQWEGETKGNVSEIYTGKDENGEICGYTMTVVTKGYGGKISVTVGIRTNGTVDGAVINSHSETEGLGAKCADKGWLSAFSGLSEGAALTKDGGTVEAVSGATITSRAVAGAINEALQFFAAALVGGGQ